MMRTLVICILVAGLVAGGAPIVTAQGQAPSDAGQPDDERANATERQQAAQERVAALRAAREATLDGFRVNRTAIIEEYRASLNETRAEFLAAKADVLAECNETRAEFTNNSGSDEAPEHADCVREGLAPLIEQARAENKAARELAASKLQEERAKGLAGWAKTLREANERYQARAGRPSGE